MPALDLTSASQSINSKISSIKAYNEISSAAKKLEKDAGNSFTESSSKISTQLNKIKDQQKRYLREPPTSTDQLLNFLGQTKGQGQSSLKYLRKKILEASAKIEPKVQEILNEETLKAIGCSQEQTYVGTPAETLLQQPLPQLDIQQGIYIPVQSVDFIDNLKTNPESEIGKIYYEPENPSADQKFVPYGGPVKFPMNKQLYQLMDANNVGKSFKQINDKFFQGKSGQNLFDVQYTTINNFGVTGDYYRMMLIDRKDSSGNPANKVGEFLKDYYSTIKFVDTSSIVPQLVNLISGAINVKASSGINEIDNQTTYALLMQRILGLCFDSRREIDVSGISKVAELDGVDESFFELTEVDLRNIDAKITNIQNGVMEFTDCDNIKLPVNTQVLIDELINFRASQPSQTIEQQVANAETILDNIIPPTEIPSLNVEMSINKNIIKLIPVAVAGAVLTPKVLLPLFTILSVVQSGASYTNTQSITTGTTNSSGAVNTSGLTPQQIANTITGITQTVNNVVTNGVDFIKKYKKFVIQVVSKINAEFIKVLYELLKKDIINLIGEVIKDITKSKITKKYIMILKLVQIIMVVSQLVNDYRKCKSLLDNILTLLNLISSISPLNKNNIPLPLLAMSSFLPGSSPERSTINTIEILQSLGVPTGAMPDGSPNLMLIYNLASNKGADKEQAENGKIDAFVAIPPMTGGIFRITGKSI